MVNRSSTKSTEAWYHVMNRGAGHQNIFHDATYFELFLGLLEDILKNYQVEVHGYCLMSNHYHLLMRTTHENLSEAMRYINGMFARKHNYLRDRDGHLFRGRYKAILVNDDSYLLQLSRYIHLNPVAAKLCQLPEQYPWSSYKYYIQENVSPVWLFCDAILEMLDSFQPGDRVENYKKFVLDGLKSDLTVLSLKKKKFLLPNQDKTIQDKSLWNPSLIRKNESKSLTTLNYIDVGNDANTSAIFIPSKKIESPETEGRSAAEKKSLITETRTLLAKQIVNIVSEYFKIDSSVILTNKFKTANNYPRKITLYLLSRVYCIERKIILDIIEGISRSGITKGCQRVKAEMEQDKELAAELDKIKLFCDNHLEL